MKHSFRATGAFLVFAAALAGCWGDGNRDNPPSVPAGLTALADNATRISLSWNPSTDDFGVAGYRVFRDGVLVETVAVPGFSDNTLAPDTVYRFAVSAFDGVGNESLRSPEVSARTKVATWRYVFAESGYGYSVVQAVDNGIVAAGTVAVAGLSYEMYLAKKDILGNRIWTSTFGERGADNTDVIHYVARTSDNGYVAAGYTSQAGVTEGVASLAKVDGAGNLVWKKTYYPGGGQAWGEGVQETPDGGFIVCGRTLYSNLAFLVKTDGTGNQVWARTYNTVNWAYDPTTAVRVASDNGYLFVFRGGTGNLVKTDPTGNVQWQTTLPTTEAFSLDLTADNGIVVAGAQGGNVFLTKTDGSGNVLWQRTYGAGIGRSVRQTLDNGYVITGYVASGGNDIILLRTDSAGTLLWQRSYGEAGDDRAYGVEPCADGGFAVSGMWTPAGSATVHPVVIKTDRDGFVP